MPRFRGDVKCCPENPVNPYGFSKLVGERALRDYDRAYGVQSVLLRYFNAAGADPEGEIGEVHDPETHLIPLLLHMPAGRRPSVTVFGTDYPTPDGTRIRDYAHVADLATAHVLALRYLEAGGASESMNLGTGTGASVKSVVEAASRIAGRSIQINVGPRRPGDPAVLVASSDKARMMLGRNPEFPDLDTQIHHAWRWVTRGGASGL